MSDTNPTVGATFCLIPSDLLLPADILARSRYCDLLKIYLGSRRGYAVYDPSRSACWAAWLAKMLLAESWRSQRAPGPRVARSVLLLSRLHRWVLALFLRGNSAAAAAATAACSSSSSYQHTEGSGRGSCRWHCCATRDSPVLLFPTLLLGPSLVVVVGSAPLALFSCPALLCLVY